MVPGSELRGSSTLTIIGHFRSLRRTTNGLSSRICRVSRLTINSRLCRAWAASPAWKRTPAFEVRLYVGSRKGYGEEQYSADKVIRTISEFQAGSKHEAGPIPVRVTSTTFVSKDYVEEGWEIAVVRYPLREDSDDDIIQWAGDLASVLMNRFHQEHISAVIRDELVVFAKE